MMPAHSPDNYAGLFEQLAADSEAALQQISELFENMLLQRIEQIVHNESLSKEVLSDTLHALWINRKEVAKKDNPVAWLVVTARHKAINMLRNEKRKRTSSLDRFSLPASADRIEAAMEAKELNGFIEQATEKLAPREKLVYTMFIKNGFSRKEIAEQLHVSEHTVKNQLRNAMINIRKHLRKLMHSILV